LIKAVRRFDAMNFDIHHPEVIAAVQRALEEDIGSGDVTTNATVAADLRAEGFFTAKQKMIVAGVELLQLLFDDVTLLKRSGDAVNAGQTIAAVRTDARTLLSRERVSLNFLQRLSGIATLARAYVDEVAGTRATVLDTRKTTPGLRRLEKMAAQAGGATNHRMGLFDAILIKNNHITLAGGIKAAVEGVQAAGTDLPIEVEVRTRGEIEEALALGVTRLLLDNMTPAQAAVEIQFIDGRASVELSGGITLTTIREFAETGADFISTGAITHSATAVDIHLRVHAA
jgi:nicotinate-nucleotide pyrophosphorylase (carboxylating)